MKVLTVLLLTGLHLTTIALRLSSAPITNLYPASVQREVDLMQSIFVVTNRGFDERLCTSVGLRDADTATVAFHQIAFVFYYPLANDVMPSSCELTSPKSLLFRKGAVVRSDADFKEIPSAYVRVFDPNRTNVVAEMDALVSVTAVDRPHRVQFVRKSFQFSYVGGWRSK